LFSPSLMILDFLINLENIQVENQRRPREPINECEL